MDWENSRIPSANRQEVVMTHSLSRRILLGGAVASLLAPRAVLAQERTAVVAAGLPEDSATPVLYGISSGAFKRVDLDVTMQPQRSGSAVASGVAGGTYQIGKISLYPLILAHAKGIPFVIIAGGGLSTPQNPIFGLLARPDSPIKTPADLVGKTVGVGSLTDMFSLTMRAWMNKHGADPATLKMVEIPISALGTAIAGGRVDAGAANEPILSEAIATGKVHLVSRMVDAIAPRFMFTAWCAMRPWADANRAACERFARVVREASALVNAHPADTVADISKFTSIPPAVIQHMQRTEAAATLDPAEIQPVIDLIAHFKEIPKAFDARELIWS
jgi:ABC-type nitrate/sulfonate/bicarbonate transport system substrate-binding protein